MRHAMAFRPFLDAGIPVAAGSDFYPGPFAPLMGMQGMVTRTGWNGEKWGLNQRITVDEALQVLTLNGAHASHEEAIKGSITPGKLADFVVLSADPHTVALTKLSQPKFALVLDVDVGTLRNWEQGRREPTGPARALLRAIRNDPENVMKALAR